MLKVVYWVWPLGHQWQPHGSGMKEKKVEERGASLWFKKLDWREGERWDNYLGVVDVS